MLAGSGALVPGGGSAYGRREPAVSRPMLSLSETIEQCCTEFGGRSAFIGNDGQPVSFTVFFLAILSFAEQLQDRGVRAGQLVDVTLRDPVTASAIRLAALRMGCLIVSLPPALQGNAGGVRPHWRVIDPIRGRQSERDIVVDHRWMRPPTRGVPIAGGGKIVKRTSGTTGEPKFRVESEQTYADRMRRNLDNRSAGDGPAFIGYSAGSSPGLNNIVRMLMSGHPQLHVQPTPEDSLRAMDRHGIVAAFVPPAGYAQLLDAAEAGGVRPRSLARITVGGGEVPPRQAARGEALFDCIVMNSYGSNETGSISHHRPVLTPDLRGVVGKVYDGLEIRFVDDEGNLRDPQEGGYLHIRPKFNRSIVEFPSGRPLCDEEGWVDTGDTGHLMPDGNLVLTGRRSELINAGGNKRSPGYFEAIVREMPGVKDVAAFRVPQETGIDRVGLAIVADEGFVLSRIEEQIASTINRVYNPLVLVVDAIPVSSAGKVDRKQLLARLAPDEVA